MQETGVPRHDALKLGQAQASLLLRDEMLKNLNRAALSLLSPQKAEHEESLSEGMCHISRMATIDRASVFRNTYRKNVLCMSQVFRWDKNTGAAIEPRPELQNKPYDEFFPRWKDTLSAEEYVNGPIRLMPEAETLAALGCLSVLSIPVFHDGAFWGFVLFENLTEERPFSKDEIGILLSASILLANTVIRNDETKKTKANTEYARLLLDATPLCCRLWDRSHNLIECNEAAAKLFGLKDKREYIDRYFELAPEIQPDGTTTRERAIMMVDRAFEHGVWRDMMLYQMPDGSPLPAENTLVRIPYGDDYVVAAYSRDLREQETMLEEMNNRDLLLQTVNTAADILLRTAPEGFEATMQVCMGMMVKAVGADRMRVIKNSVEDGQIYRSLLHEWCENVPPMKGTVFTTKVSYTQTTPAMLETMLRREPVHSSVRNMPVSDQEWFSSQGVKAILMFPVFAGDEFWGMVGFDNCHDEELYAETDASIMQSGGMIIANALLRIESILQLRDTSVRLEAALKDAESANLAKSRFLAQMSHEIRTPLNAVIGLAELALDNNTPQEDFEDKLDKIHTSGMTILNIVNDILDISKIESGKFELYRTEYDTPSLINDTVMLNIVRIGDKPVEFRLFVDENMPVKLFGDDLRVKQVFNNLLSNAFKYTNEGVVEWHIRVEEDSEGVWLVSNIKDTGIGIRPEEKEKLFSDYYQADERSNRQVEGTGLGLAITKRLVEKMDGSVTVESEFGKGSVFSVRLRQGYVSGGSIGKDAAESLMGLRYAYSKRSRISKLARVNLSYANVLIVDDIPTNLDVVKGIMMQYGLQVDCASSGPQAIEMVLAGSPRYSAVFMDYMMPGMDGFETMQIIREEIGTEYAREVPIIALTANAIVGNEEMFLKRGFQAFLSKPIDLFKLDAILRQWVRDKELEKKLPAAAGMLPVKAGYGVLPDGFTINGVELSMTLESVGGNVTALLNVLNSYVADTQRLLEEMDGYLTEGNLVSYAVAAHGIKGASNIIFALEAGKMAEGLEFAAKTGELTMVKGGHRVFAEATKALLDRIDKALRRISTAERPVAAAPAPALLRELREACARFDMSGADALMERLEAYRYETGGDLITWLRAKINDIAYEEIASMGIPDHAEDTNGN